MGKETGTGSANDPGTYQSQCDLSHLDLVPSLCGVYLSSCAPYIVSPPLLVNPF